jgi:hypothetical protein
MKALDVNPVCLPAQTMFFLLPPPKHLLLDDISYRIIMKSDYFVELNNYDSALKQREQYKFLVDKFRINNESVKDSKELKIREIDSFIAILDLLEVELREFKKLLPAEPTSAGASSKEDPSEAPVRKTVKKKTTKKKVTTKTAVKKAGKSINELKLGLEKIKDELANL